MENQCRLILTIALLLATSTVSGTDLSAEIAFLRDKDRFMKIMGKGDVVKFDKLICTGTSGRDIFHGETSYMELTGSYGLSDGIETYDFANSTYHYVDDFEIDGEPNRSMGKLIALSDTRYKIDVKGDTGKTIVQFTNDATMALLAYSDGEQTSSDYFSKCKSQ